MPCESGAAFGAGRQNMRDMICLRKYGMAGPRSGISQLTNCITLTYSDCRSFLQESFFPGAVFIFFRGLGGHGRL